MRYITIPQTDLQVSALCLGSTMIGSDLDEAASFEVMDAFADAGGNFLDTARVYADWLPGGHGASEKTIGAWLTQRKNRDHMVIGTKGAHPDLKTMHISRMSEREIAADIDESLRCLRTDRIDLYWLHRDDEKIPVEAILDIMEKFVRRGKIRYYGCSNWKTPRIRAAWEHARAAGVKGFLADQPQWSLADLNPGAYEDQTLVNMGPELYELHRQTGLAALPYTSQAKGFFSKFAENPAQLDGKAKARFWNEKNIARARLAQEFAHALKVPVAAIPLAWLIHQPFTTIPIIGSRNVDQLQESLTAADLLLERDMVKKLTNP